MVLGKKKENLSLNILEIILFYKKKVCFSCLRERTWYLWYVGRS